MSYLYARRRPPFGFGDVASAIQGTQALLAKIPSGSPTYKYIDAVNTVISDAQTVSSMTSTALSLLTSINAITDDAVTGAALTIASDTSALAADVGGAIADGVGDVLDIVPVVGAIIGAIIKIAAGVAGASAAGSAAQEQMVAAGANGFMQTAVPVGIDSNEINPADIFAQVYEPDPSFNDQGMAFIRLRPQRLNAAIAKNRVIPPCPGNLAEIYCYPGGYTTITSGPSKGQAEPTQQATSLGEYLTGGMPAIGWALARATEGYGLSSPDLAQLTAWYRAGVNPTWGIDAPRRAIYRKLRRAIQAQLGVMGSNEGQDLWPIYLDMLREDFDAGRLSEEWITVLLSPPFNPARFGGVLTLADPSDYADFGIPDLSPLAAQIVKLVNQWRIANNPVTLQDIQKFVDVVASATPGMNAAAIKASVTPGNAASVVKMLQATIANDVKIATATAIANKNKPPLSPAAAACQKASGTWTGSTCTTTRVGVHWDATKLAFVQNPVPLILVTPTKTPAIVALALGAFAVGGVFVVAKAVKKRKAARVAAAGRR